MTPLAYGDRRGPRHGRTVGPAAGGTAQPAADGGRDHGIDALRAVAIGGVVLGHWLVTALVVRADGSLATASPLADMGWLAPATWLLQTLGLFFFVAGFAAARSRRQGRAADTAPTRWSRRAGQGRLARRLAGLGRPALGFLAGWTLLLCVAALAGTPAGSLRTVAGLAVSPLWFLAVLAGLTALTAPVRRLVHGAHGPALAVGAGVLVVAAADAGAGIAPLTILAAWLVPYALGVAHGAGRLGGASGRRVAWSLLLGGAIAVIGLIQFAGYPASAVGVPGAGRSNLDPPSLATVALALAQVGAALLLRERLGRPRPAVSRINQAAMGVYLWHQSALIGVGVLVLLLAGTPVAGLHTAPTGAAWLVLRLPWLMVFAVTLGLILMISRRRRDVRPGGTVVHRGCTLSDVSDPDDSLEVIAVRDGDPPSRGRARQHR